MCLTHTPASVLPETSALSRVLWKKIKQMHVILFLCSHSWGRANTCKETKDCLKFNYTKLLTAWPCPKRRLQLQLQLEQFVCQCIRISRRTQSSRSCSQIRRFGHGLSSVWGRYKLLHNYFVSIWCSTKWHLFKTDWIQNYVCKGITDSVIISVRCMFTESDNN